ncbi:MAG: bacteriorhodopsin [Janthinobacterium lividum]
MDSSSWLWLTAVIMLIGGLGILLTGKRRTKSEELHTVLHGIVPIIAACSYFAMATSQGSILLPFHTASNADGTRIFYFARYIDWFFTTPLLLISLSMTAMHAGIKRNGAIAGIVLADVIMIVTSFFFGASEVSSLKWTWFIISCVAFLGVYYVIWVSLMQANREERDDVQMTYRRNATILSVLWLIYPLVLLLSPDGMYAIGDTVAVVCILILDILAKVVYGFMSTASDTKITDRDLSEGYTASATARTAR